MVNSWTNKKKCQWFKRQMDIPTYIQKLSWKLSKGLTFELVFFIYFNPLTFTINIAFRFL